jgi:hypothetical protein
VGKSIKLLLVFSCYVLLGVLVFHPALRIGFLGDFAGDLYTSQGSWLNFEAYHWNFYLPAMALYHGLYQIFALSPQPYQVFHLALIFINAGLVYLLAREFKFAAWQCWLAGLLELFNSAAFEAYFWLSAIPKTLATGFGLLALIFLNRLRQSPALIWGWGYLLMEALGMAIESTGLILPLLGLILDVYYRPWRRAGKVEANLFSGLKLHFWSFGSAAIFLLLRHFLGIKPYAENLPPIQKVITLGRTILSTFFHGLPDHLWLELQGIPLTAGILILLLSIILLLAWHFKQGADKSRFITLLLLWLGASLPHTIGSHFHSRYLYFPGVFAALVMADLLGSFRLRLGGRNCTGVAIALAIIAFLSWDFYVFRQSSSHYIEASHIYDAGIQKIKTYFPAIPPGTRLTLIDFPDNIYRPQNLPQENPTGYRILVYRNAFPHHLLLLYPGQKFIVTLVRLSPPNNDNPEPLGTLSSPEAVAKMATAPQTVICRYLPGNPGNFVIGRGSPTTAAPILK